MKIENVLQNIFTQVEQIKETKSGQQISLSLEEAMIILSVKFEVN